MLIKSTSDWFKWCSEKHSKCGRSLCKWHRSSLVLPLKPLIFWWNNLKNLFGVWPLLCIMQVPSTCFRELVVQKKSSFIVTGVFFNLFDVVGAELFCSMAVVECGFSTWSWVSSCVLLVWSFVKLKLIGISFFCCRTDWS